MYIAQVMFISYIKVAGKQATVGFNYVLYTATTVYTTLKRSSSHKHEEHVIKEINRHGITPFEVL